MTMDEWKEEMMKNPDFARGYSEETERVEKLKAQGLSGDDLINPSVRDLIDDLNWLQGQSSSRDC